MLSSSLSTCWSWRLGVPYFCYMFLMLTTRVSAFNNYGGGVLNIPMHTLSKTKPSSIGTVRNIRPLQYIMPHQTATNQRPMMYLSSTTDANTSNKSRSKRSNKRTAAAVVLGALIYTSSATIANAAKKAVVESSPALVLPTIPRLALVCIIPTLLGYYKSEYGVSYGYGTAMAASSALILSSIANAAQLPLLPAATTMKNYLSVISLTTSFNNLRALLTSSLPAFHSFALFFYGTRLDLFLLYREVFLARFRAMRERIEERAKKQGSRLKRTPFLVSCAFLYFCMMSPLLITTQMCEGMSMVFRPIGKDLVNILETALRSTVMLSLLGFLLGAIGDINKTIGKAIKGEDALITGGIFRFFRHPNYTGEVIGWVSSCLAGFLAVVLKTVSSTGGGLALWKSMAPYLLLSVMGATGISFVLATATTGLEFRQKEKYGDTDEYKEWIEKSWVGFRMTPKAKEEADEESESGDN